MSKAKEIVDLANTPSAYYAPAVAVPHGHKLIHVAGQPGVTHGGLVPDDYQSQIHLALLNLRKVIITAGAAITDIVKLNLLIVNYDGQKRLHARHIERFLGGHRPAVTLIPVPQLAVASWLFEVDAVLAVQETPAVQLQQPSQSDLVDVVIIGAGLAGLTAARDITNAGFSCIVLEARDRVGGKTWSVPLGGGEAAVDLGAAWINDTNQNRIYGLARQFGADLIEQNTRGHAVLQNVDGKSWSFPYGELPAFDDAIRRQMADIRDLVEADCQCIDVWKPRDNNLDNLTFEAYLRSKNIGDGAIASATVWTRAMLGQEPRDISALFFLHYCKSGGGLLQMRSDRKGGAQALRVRQGTQIFAKGLASALPAGTVQLKQSVKAVFAAHGQEPVRIQTTGGTMAARKVVTTVPGPALKSIAFSPPLPPSKQLLFGSLTYGYYAKAMMEFSTPFWINKGFCGLVQSFVGPASIVRDSSIPAESKYVLTCFMAADPGRAWAALPAGERETRLLAQLAQAFASDDAHQYFVRLLTYEWANDEFAGYGCPCTSLGPGVLDTVGADSFREPCGNLHFAGTETAGEWKGYMEGAVRSGERVSREVIEVLSAQNTSRL